VKKLSKFLSFFLLIIFVISTILLIQIFWQENQQKFLKIVFLDVGQGDSIFIETPNGFQTLIDAGPNSTVVRSLSKYTSFYDRNIDLLIATHSDSDHVAGFVEIIKRFNIENFAQNFVEDTDSLNSEINNLIEEDQINKYFLKSGDKIFLDEKENIYLEVLWPPQDHVEEDNNDNSIITRLVYNQIKVMLTGDAAQEIENKLVEKFGEKNKNLKAEILKAGHHGSKTSTSLEFLSMVSPKFIIISAEKDNRFGHPHQEVLDNIDNFSQQISEQNTDLKIKILETSVLGSIYFESDGEEIWLKN
jgi:competence protein ComEC